MIAHRQWAWSRVARELQTGQEALRKLRHGYAGTALRRRAEAWLLAVRKPALPRPHQ